MNQNAALSRWLYYCKRRPSKFRRQHGITHLPRSLKSDSAEKPYVHPSRNLRTNGAAVEIIGDFSVHAEPGRSIPVFFSRIKNKDLTLFVPPKCSIQTEVSTRIMRSGVDDVSESREAASPCHPNWLNG